MAVSCAECGIIVLITGLFIAITFFPSVVLIVSIGHLWRYMMPQWHLGVNGPSVLLLVIAVFFPRICFIACLGQWASMRVYQLTRPVVRPVVRIYLLDAA